MIRRKFGLANIYDNKDEMLLNDARVVAPANQTGGGNSVESCRVHDF